MVWYRPLISAVCPEDSYTEPVVEIRFIESGELADYRHAIDFGFGQDPSSDDRALQLFEAITTPETSIVAVDRGKIVATFGSYDLDMTMPGGAVAAMAGTTHVTVHPTHRRQGLLTKMMRLHIDQAIERGQPMAGLWSSEERIYGRFGYGPAIWGHDLKISARTVDLGPPVPGISVHPLTAEEAQAVLPPVYDRQLPTAAAGRLVRSMPWWDARRFYNRPDAGPGTKRRFVVAERDGEPVGYVIFRLVTPDGWEEGTTQIIELIAADDQVRRGLWNFVTNVDLFRHVSWFNAPVDEPMLVEADRFRAVTRSVIDAVWVRPLDLPALLSARRYDRDGVVGFAVTDRFGPTEGRYRLEVVGGVGACHRIDGAAADSGSGEVALSVEDLGRLVMGGGSAVALERAGRIEGSAQSVATLHDLLATRNQPHCPEVF